MRAVLSMRCLVRSFWEGLVTLGLMHLADEGDDLLHEVLLHNGPPPGHPERLRPDLPLTPLERRLRRELHRASRTSGSA